jgi:3-isopropylmalate/(R)-2-methylmalate dehydratase large subunit
MENIKTDADADEEINFEASDIEPMITGTNPGMDRNFKKAFQLKMLLRRNLC